MQNDDDVEYIKNDYEFTIKYKNKSFFNAIKQKYQPPKIEKLPFDEELRLYYEQLIAHITLSAQEKEQQTILLTQKSMVLAVLMGFRKGTASFKDVIDAIEQNSQYNKAFFFCDTQKYIDTAIDLYEGPLLEKERLKLLLLVQNQLNEFLEKKEGKNKKQFKFLYIAKHVLEGTTKQEVLKQVKESNSCDKKVLKLLNQVLDLDLQQLEDQQLIDFGFKQ